MTDLLTEPVEPKSFLSELVGEGKKFKTEEDLARGKYEADTFIEVLKRQQDALREDYNRLRSDYDARAKFEDVVDRMNNDLRADTGNTTQQPEVRDKPIDVNKFKEIAQQTFSEFQTKQRQEANTQEVINVLKDRYGSNYQEMLLKQTQELGLDKESLNYMARTSPKALISALGLNSPQKTEPFQTPPRSTTFAPTVPKKRTWSYYQELKKSDPKTYYDPKTNVQMEKDYLALGADFEDGDFRRYGDGAFA